MEPRCWKFFDIMNYNNYDKLICLSKFIFLKIKKKLFDYSLRNKKISNKRFDLFLDLVIEKETKKNLFIFKDNK